MVEAIGVPVGGQVWWQRQLWRPQGADALQSPGYALLALRRPFSSFGRMAQKAREYALLTGRFWATEVHWPLSSDEIDERTDTARPTPVR